MDGKAVCYNHGGKSPGGKKGNKCALKTGAHETILEATLSDEEKDYMQGLPPDPATLLLDNLRILKIREVRTMQRIHKLRQAEALAGQPTGQVDEKGAERRHPQLVVREGSQTVSSGEKGASTSATTHNESYAQVIQRWEKGLTEIQDQIRRTLESLAKILPPAVPSDAHNTGVLVTPGILVEDIWEAAAQK